MPYILSPIITEKLPGLWGEGAPYKKELIYDINSTDPSLPPVSYYSHILKPHSLPHLDAPAHIIPNAEGVSYFFKNALYNSFFGKTHVIRLKPSHHTNIKLINDHTVWEISKAELSEVIQNNFGSDDVRKLFITIDNYPTDNHNSHDPKSVLVLSEEAANWLIEKYQNFQTFGTSWKSTDFRPGSRERPIHKIFLSRNLSIYECLNLKDVPTGNYFLSAFPLPLENASESPVCPVLFTREELFNLM